MPGAQREIVSRIDPDFDKKRDMGPLDVATEPDSVRSYPNGCGSKIIASGVRGLWTVRTMYCGP